MAYAQTQFVNTSALYNGSIEVSATVEAANPNGLISFLFYSTAGGGTPSSPNGYLFKFDSKSGDYAGRIYKVAAGVATEIGSVVPGVVVNAAQLTGPHHINCQYNKTGKMHIIIDGILIAIATDTTYAVNSTIGYGEEGGAGYVSNIAVKGHYKQAAGDADANMRALVDLSQAGHPNKQVDSLTDNTYARPLASRINSGKPLIDFSEGIHVNKHLGNIPDDTSSGGRRAHPVGPIAGRLAAGTAGAHALYHAHDQGIYGTTYRVNAGATAWVPIGAGTMDDIDEAGSTTYGRPIKSRLSSGKPLIDFSEGIHLSKNMDNIPDGVSGTIPRTATMVGTIANRPAAGTAKRHYHATDQGVNGTTYRDTGAAWVKVGTGHLGDADGTVDNVTDGATYARTKGTTLASGVPKKDILHMFSSAILDVDGIRIDVTNAVG